MNCDMNLLINPNILYIDNEVDIWNDLMVYLSWIDNADTSMNNNQGKPLLKCGFVVTGCPKKIWALNLKNIIIHLYQGCKPFRISVSVTVIIRDFFHSVSVYPWSVISKPKTVSVFRYPYFSTKADIPFFFPKIKIWNILK